MKRYFPAPLFSVALALLWLVLNQSISPGNLLLALILGFLAPLLMAPLRPLPVRIRRPGVIIRLFFMVGRDMVASNLAIGWAVWNVRRPPPRSGFVKVPLQLRDANGLAALAIISSVVPGTIWSELALDRSMLLIHVFDLEDEAQFIEHFKTTYERPLMEIFQ